MLHVKTLCGCTYRLDLYAQPRTWGQYIDGKEISIGTLSEYPKVVVGSPLVLRGNFKKSRRAFMLETSPVISIGVDLRPRPAVGCYVCGMCCPARPLYGLRCGRAAGTHMVKRHIIGVLLLAVAASAGECPRRACKAGRDVQGERGKRQGTGGQATGRYRQLYRKGHFLFGRPDCAGNQGHDPAGQIAHGHDDSIGGLCGVREMLG